MTARIVGPTCSEPGCNRPQWDQHTGLCSNCWRLKRLTGMPAEPSERSESLEACEQIWAAS